MTTWTFLCTKGISVQTFTNTHAHTNTHNLLPSPSTVPEITSHLAQGILLNTNTTQKLNTQRNKCKPSHGEGTFWEELSLRERKEVREEETRLTWRVKVSVCSPGEPQPERGIFGSWVSQIEGLEVYAGMQICHRWESLYDQHALSPELICAKCV